MASSVSHGFVTISDLFRKVQSLSTPVQDKAMIFAITSSVH